MAKSNEAMTSALQGTTQVTFDINSIYYFLLLLLYNYKALASMSNQYDMQKIQKVK